MTSDLMIFACEKADMAHELKVLNAIQFGNHRPHSTPDLRKS
jgi:hypothetical protein